MNTDQTVKSSGSTNNWTSYHQLCGSCQDILSKLPVVVEELSKKKRISTNIKICDFGELYKNEPNHLCKLCWVLWESRNKMLRQASEEVSSTDERDTLWASNFLERVEGPHRQKSERNKTDFVILTIIPTSQNHDMIIHDMHKDWIIYDIPTLALFDESWNAELLCTPKILSPGFDPCTALRWLEACNTHHSSCSPPTNERTEITLIDCTTRQITSLDMTYPYVALSYVWGNVVPVPLINGVEVPANTSAVIMDAIHLTNALGFKYLWADQYCINQTDLQVKMKQISQMDLVYGQAELTIVAACGDSAAHGLPGVCGRKRRAFQNPVRAGNFQIVELGPDGRCDLVKSKWSTRGWTFQEAWLSRRLLCFTDNQCYFECRSISCSESLECAERIWEIDNPSMESSHLEYGPFARCDQIGRAYSPLEHIDVIHIMLQSYSRRELSFDEDALNAVLGIFNSSEAIRREVDDVETEDIRLAILLGIPLMVGSLYDISLLEQTLVTGLSWFHFETSDLFSGKPKYPLRRSSFPSWTWAGWKGVIHQCWLSMNYVLFDSVVQNVRVFSDKGSSQTSVTRLSISEIGSLIPSTLCFESLQIPHDWLSYTEEHRPHPRWYLRGSAVDVYMSEPIDPAHLLRSLGLDGHRLALIGYSREEKEGLVWLLRKVDSAYSRAGILRIKPGDAIGPFLDNDDNTNKRRVANEKLTSNMMLLIESAVTVYWEIV